jgi:hypothetical protein
VLTRHIDQARADLVNNINPTSTAFLDRLQGMTGLFRERGLGPTEAQNAALASIDGLIQRQAAMIAYDYIFLGIGLLFVFCIFLLPLLRAPKAKVSAEHAALAE